MFDEEEQKKEMAEAAGKELIRGLLDDSKELSNMSAYARSILRKQKDYSCTRNEPSKDLRVRYGLFGYDRLGASYVWWLLEQLEKGNVTIKEDAFAK
jgi:uncharacterized protein YcfL